MFPLWPVPTPPAAGGDGVISGRIGRLAHRQEERSRWLENPTIALIGWSDRVKAAKKAERLKAKRERSAKGAKDSDMPNARPEPDEG